MLLTEFYFWINYSLESHSVIYDEMYGSHGGKKKKIEIFYLYRKKIYFLYINYKKT